MKRPIASTLSIACALSTAAGGGIAHAGGGHHKKVYVQTAQAPAVYAAQAPMVYAAQAPTVYAAQAPTVYATQAPTVYAAQTAVAQAPVVYNMVAQTGSAPAVGNAPGDEECKLEPDERRDIVEELRAVKADAVKDKSSLSERRTAVRDRASELVVEVCNKDADDPGVKKVVRSLVSEVMTGSAPTTVPQGYPGYGSGQGYVTSAGYPVPAAYPAAFVPAPYVLIPIGPVLFAPAPKHCLHNLFHPCARCRGY